METLLIVNIILISVYLFYRFIEWLMPLYLKDAKWTIFIWLNLKNLVKVNDCFLLKKKNKSYVVVFLEAWLFHIYEGGSVGEIRDKYDLGGHSSRACYLKFWQKIIGNRIEKYYKNILSV